MVKPREPQVGTKKIVDGSTNWIRWSPFMAESRKLESSPWNLGPGSSWSSQMVIADITAATMVVMRKDV